LIIIIDFSIQRNWAIRSILLLVLCCALFACKGKGTEPAIEEQIKVDELTELPDEKEIEQKAEAQTTAAVGGSSGVVTSTQVSSPLSALSRRLPSMGVYTQEIDPLNFDNPDLEVLRQMGAEQYIISYFVGEQFYKSGDYDKALTEYSAAINLYGNFTEALVSRGNAWMKKKDYNRAIDDYTRAIRLDGSRAELYNYRGFARSERREMNLAIEDFTRAIALNANYTDALINRSHAYFQTGNYDKVIEDCDRIVRLEPRNAIIWNRRGSAWYLKEDDDKAIRDFTEAIRLKNDYAIAYLNRANALYSKKDYNGALADINRAIALNSSLADANALKEKIQRQL